MALTMSSPAFAHEHGIPDKYTCEGQDVSPPLEWSGVPEGTRSLALIVDDPDAPDPSAPKMTFVHWILYNIPPEVRGLAEDAAGGALPPGVAQGINDFNRKTYGGPCPPVGRHRYFFKLYALDQSLPDLGASATKSEVERAMQGHVLDETNLLGTYEKKGH